MEIKHIDLEKVIMFLDNLKFKGIGSIHRSKITNRLTEVIREVADGEKVIREDYKGQPSKLNEELSVYFNETTTLKGDDIYKPMQTIKQRIKELTSEDSQEEFNGEQAYVLHLLYDKFNLEEENEDE